MASVQLRTVPWTYVRAPNPINDSSFPIGCGSSELSRNINLHSFFLKRNLPSSRRKPACDAVSNKETVSELVAAGGVNMKEESGNNEREGDRRRLSPAEIALQETLKVKSTLGHTTTELRSNNIHRLWVGLGAAAVLGMLAKSIIAVNSGESALSAVVSGVAAYILADLGTGIYHWGVDNYGDANTPIFGPQIDAFQGHHQRPWTITQREFANNLQALARPAFFFLLPFLFTPNNAAVDAFLSVFLACVVLSQQFHSWSHTRKNQLPEAVVALQDMGFLVGRKMHGSHHKPPYNINYCIVSGICNKFVDSSGLYFWMEETILKIWGVAPRSWGETAPEWIEIGYFDEGQTFDEV